MNDWKILYTLIILLKSGKECNGFNQQQFTIIQSHALSAYNRTKHSISAMACCRECLREKWCYSVTHNRNSRECHLSDVPSVEAGTYLKDDISSDVYILDDWLTVFRGFPGIGVDPRDSWLTGNGTTSDPTCQHKRAPSCDKHYRNPLVDLWAELKSSQVKIVFYKGELEKFITFNAVGSNISNWFDKNRVLASSWTTLVSTRPYRYFSIEGDINRRFITTAPYIRCTEDRIFTVVLTEVKPRCLWDQQTKYPQFLFATGDDMGFPQNNTGITFADSFAIFISPW